MNFRWFIAISAVLLVPLSASGAVIIGNNSHPGSNGLADYEGTFTYTPTGANSATLVVTLKNTTPAANGGALTGFAFNNPSNLITGVNLVSASPANFNFVIGGPTYQNSVNGQPFGSFDIAVGTKSGNFLGGKVNNGVPIGQTGSWTLNLSGNGIGALDESDFVNTKSVNGTYRAFFLARFQGIDVGEGSDKVPAKLHNPSVPEPGTLVVWAGLSVACLYFRRRR